jgi:protein-L-isoaspartate(D-aspartate) O-methyltransferase
MLSAAELASRRAALIEKIVREVARHGTGTGEHALDPRVLAALAKMPRERFVPAELQEQAYRNRPLPIGAGQTISQPLIVALMTHLLRLRPDARVLEVGTGSGYQTAILAELAAEVVTIEVIPALAEAARAVLAELGYPNIAFHVGDGAVGCPAQAPFDAILVTAAPDAVPARLVEQLAPGGRMVIPCGTHRRGQDLMLIEQDAAGQITRRTLFPVAFVPLT